jgi:enoyl-CoA hydratase
MTHIEYSSEGAVVTIALNRPTKRNAVTIPMQHELARLFAAIAIDGDARALVLTGAGADFSVGGDRTIAARMDTQPGFEEEAIGIHRATITALLALDIPVIGAIEGAAFGFGAELVACCDMVLLSETARLADPHVPHGRGPGPIALLAWPLQTSRVMAAELILTGREVGAHEAVALGLANRVVAAGTARAEAAVLARSIAAMPPRGVTITRRALRLRMSEVDALYPGALGA